MTCGIIGAAGQHSQKAENELRPEFAARGRQTPEGFIARGQGSILKKAEDELRPESET